MLLLHMASVLASSPPFETTAAGAVLLLGCSSLVAYQEREERTGGLGVSFAIALDHCLHGLGQHSGGGQRSMNAHALRLLPKDHFSTGKARQGYGISM
jgi:hypothetical protein